MVLDHSNFILKHYLEYSKKTRMPVFDAYTAREEAEDHTTSHSGHVETADEAFELASSAVRKTGMIRMVCLLRLFPHS